MKKWLIWGLGQELYKISLDHLVVTESKEVLKNPTQPKTQNLHIVAGDVKAIRSQLKKNPKAKVEI